MPATRRIHRIGRSEGVGPAPRSGRIEGELDVSTCGCLLSLPDIVTFADAVRQGKISGTFAWVRIPILTERRQDCNPIPQTKRPAVDRTAGRLFYVSLNPFKIKKKQTPPI